MALEAGLARARGTNPTSGAWEWNSDTIHKQGWLVIIWNARMHDRAISIAFKMFQKALELAGPYDLTGVHGLVRRNSSNPRGEIREVIFHFESNLGCDAIQKGIAESLSIAEVYGHVDEVKLTPETLSIERSHQH